MLVEFSVRNFRSIKNKQTLSMVPDEVIKQYPNHAPHKTLAAISPKCSLSSPDNAYEY